MKSRWGRGIVAGLWVAGCGSSGADNTSDPGPGGPTTPTAPPVPVTRANGQLTAWSTGPAMPVARANHCSVVANGYLVVIGGNYKPKGATDFKNLADVHVARIAADGSLGEWKLAGSAPSAVNSCTAASDGKSLYLVDGIFDDATKGSKVRRAPLSDGGDLGAWQDLGALPVGVRVLYSNASVYSGTLVALHARLPDDGDGVALVGAPIAGSSLGSWKQTTWLTGFRGHPQYAFAKPNEAGSNATYVYALGGYSGSTSGNAVLADGAGAALDTGEAPGKSFAVPALPKPTSFGQAIGVDDYVFVVGGKDDVLSGKGRADAYVARVEGGPLGAWATVASLPQGRTSHSLALHGDFLYVTGGGFDAGGLDTVFTARVRFPVP